MTVNPSRDFSYFALGRISGTILQGIFFLIFAAILDPEKYGELSYIIAIAGTASIISRFGVPYSVVVYRAKGHSILSNEVNIFVIISTGIASLILIPVNIYAAVLCFALSLFVVNVHNLLGLKKYKKHMLTTIIQGILINIIPIGLYFVFEIPGVLIGLAISNLLCSFQFLLTLNSKINSFQNLRKNFKVLTHNFGIDASLNLTKLVDKLIIVPLFGFFVAGIFHFNLQILYVLETLPLLLHSFLLSEESSGVIHKKITIGTILVSGLLALLVIFFSPVFIQTFFPKYEEGIFSLQILISSVIPLSISSILSAKLQAKESTKIGFSAIVRIFSLLVLLALLVDIYGFAGLAMAVLISSCLNVIFLTILYKKS